MLKVISKLAIAAAVVGLAMAGSGGSTLAKGAKKPASCAPGTLRVTKATCSKWGCHYQRCWWNGSAYVWYPTPAFCAAPHCPKY